MSVRILQGDCRDVLATLPAEKGPSMTPIADMVEKMISGGIPPEFILLAIRTVEQCSARPVDEAAERRRRWDRDRKRKASEEGNSTGIPPDNAKAALSLEPSSSNSQKEKEGRKERARGTVCPPEFHPTEAHYAYGERKNVPRWDVDHACDRMRNWSEANANRAVARKKDWGKALFQWIDTAAEKGKVNGHRAGGLTEAKERLLARGAEFERQADHSRIHELPGGGDGGRSIDGAIPEPESG